MRTLRRRHDDQQGRSLLLFGTPREKHLQCRPRDCCPQVTASISNPIGTSRSLKVHAYNGGVSGLCRGQFTFSMTAPCEKGVRASMVLRAPSLQRDETASDEGQNSEIRVELRFGEGVYSGLGPSHGDLSRQGAKFDCGCVRSMAKPVPRPESLLAALPADLS